MRALYALRKSAAALSLFISLRYSWVQVNHAWLVVQAREKSETSVRHGEAPPPKGVAELASEAGQRRVAQLNEVEKELNLASGAGSGGGSQQPALRVRHVVVDWGPERSEVFINGQLVGQTPYGGQFSCADGSNLEVTVLPTQGAPLRRTLNCSGIDVRPGL
jgi:hypothetical protein